MDVAELERKDRKCLIINDKIDEFMKTLEEVKAHLVKVGYNREDMPRIEGFLFGKGLYEGDEFEIEYIDGCHDFYDFKDWFNGEEKTKTPIDWSEFGFGDFIHVEGDLNVIVLGDIYDGKFVGTTGNIVHLFELTNESRPCDEHEIEIIENKLKENGVAFCSDVEEFVPLNKCKECELEKTNDYLKEKLNSDMKDLRKIAESMSKDHPLKDFAMTMTNQLEEIVGAAFKEKVVNSDYIDKLEVDAKEAIENIVANLHSGKLMGKESQSLIDALNVLVELGKMYE